MITLRLFSSGKLPFFSAKREARQHAESKGLGVVAAGEGQKWLLWKARRVDHGKPESLADVGNHRIHAS